MQAAPLCSTLLVLARSRTSRRENAGIGPKTLRFVFFKPQKAFVCFRVAGLLHEPTSAIRHPWLWPCRYLRKCFGWGGHESSSVLVRSPPCRKFSTKPALRRARGSSRDYKRRWRTGTRPRLLPRRPRYLTPILLLPHHDVANFIHTETRGYFRLRYSCCTSRPDVFRCC